MSGKTTIHSWFSLPVIVGILLYSVFCSAVFSPASAEENISVKAHVDRTQISLEDTITLTITINSNKPRVETSSIKDFEIYSHSTSSNYSFINGSTKKEFKHVYVLAPKKTGQLTIPPLPVIRDNERYLTNAIRVNVTKNQTTPDAVSNAFVKASVSSDKLFIGEQLIYTFSFIRNIRVANLGFSAPSFEGFTAKSLGDEKQYKKIIDNKEYLVSELQFLLTPISAGTVTLEPSTLRCDIIISTPGQRGGSPLDSFFNDSFFGRTKTRRKHLKTDAKTIDVKPLPAYPFKEPFTGVVGQIDLQAQLDNPTIKTGESATLRITISGTGNIEDADEPQLAIPKALKKYDDTPATNVAATAKGISGNKTFKAVLVALTPGDYTIGPIKFPYFNTQTKAYEILVSKAITLHVDQADKPVASTQPSSGDNQAGSQTLIKQDIEYTGRDILPLHESIKAIAPQKPLSFKRYLLLLFIPVVVSGFLIALIQILTKEKSQKTRMQNKIKTLLKTASTTNDNNAFLSAIYKVIVYSINATVDEPGESLTAMEAKTILDRNNIDKEASHALIDLLSAIEGLRFSGRAIASEDKKALLEQTRKAIRRLS